MALDRLFLKGCVANTQKGRGVVWACLMGVAVRALQEMREECEGYEGGVSDEDMEEEEEEEEEAVITEAEYRQILRQHRKRRRGNEVRSERRKQSNVFLTVLKTHTGQLPERDGAPVCPGGCDRAWQVWGGCRQQRRQRWEWQFRYDGHRPANWPEIPLSPPSSSHDGRVPSGLLQPSPHLLLVLLHLFTSSQGPQG